MIGELKPQEERNGSTLLLVLFLKGNTKEMCEYKRYETKSIKPR